MVTVIIVNFNSTQKTNILIKSLSKIDNIVFEIIVVDNNSGDIKNILIKNKVRVVYNSSNLGFAKATNQGISLSKTNIVLLLNPDTKLIDNSPLKSFQLIKSNKNASIVGGKILKSIDRTESKTATSKPTFLTMLFEFTILKKVFKNNIFSKRFWIEKHLSTKHPSEVFSLCGAYMFIKKSAFKNVKKLFDESYFLYLEDLDIGYRAEENNRKVIFDPRSHILHIGGYSSKSKFNIVYDKWLESRTTFTKKHFNGLMQKILLHFYNFEQFILINYHYYTNTPHV